MLTVTVACLILLALLMRQCGGTLLFPPALFCAVWGVTLAGDVVTQGFFLPISEYACLIFLVGAVAFSCGGVMVLYRDGGRTQQWTTRAEPARISRTILDLALVLLVLAFPYYVHVAFQVAGTSNPVLLLATIRLRTVEAGQANPFGVAANLNVLAPLVAIAMAFESDGTLWRRARVALAVLLALAYSVLTGSKGGALVLMTLFFVTQIRSRRIKATATLTAVVLVVAFFAGGLLAVNRAGRSVQDTEVLARYLGEEVASYWLGSPVAFSEMARKPDSMASAEKIDRFFVQTGKSLGMAVEVPDINAKYTTVGSDGQSTNTYTIYFSYFKDYGWLGAVLLLAAVSAILTLIWRSAMRGEPVASLMYASLCTATVQSMYSENYFLGINGYLKAWLFYLAVYRLLPPLIAVASGTAIRRGAPLRA